MKPNIKSSRWVEWAVKFSMSGYGGLVKLTIGVGGPVKLSMGGLESP